MAEKPDPTKEPEFQKVIRHFVTTPPRQHESLVEELKHASEGDAQHLSKKRGRPKKRES